MNSNLEQNWDVDQEVYETPNRGTILEPISLQKEERHVKHQVSLVGMGAKREVWIGGPHRHLGYKRQSLILGIKLEVYLREGGIHAFKHYLLFKNMGTREI